jgi:methyl-accepting chemotaxis protein
MYLENSVSSNSDRSIPANSGCAGRDLNTTSTKEPYCYMPSDDNAVNFINRATRKLKDCTQVLEVLSASTEDQFLDIGARLSSFYERTAKVSELSRTAVGLMSGADLTRTIEGLTTLMEEFEFHLKHFDDIIGENITKLNTISERMENVEWRLEDIDRITRTLGGLGLNIRVQNAILKRPVEGIRVLGEDVKKLSEDITEKSGYITRDTKNLAGIVHGSRLRISELSTVQKNEAAKIIKSTASNIGSLEDTYGRSARSARVISSHSQEISQSIQEIVVVIQFHDIMRQQFEHSRNAFIRIARLLEEAHGRDDLSQTASDLLRFCVHEGAPLCRTRENFVTTVLSVIENLKVLSASVNRLLDEVKLLLNVGSSTEGSFLETSDVSLASVHSSVTAFSASGMVKGELSGATTVVVNTLAEISGFIKAIEYIGDEIELIAFNAAVQADQIGEEGRALGVVADQIQRLSAAAQINTTSITGILKDVGSYAEELSSGVGTGERDYVLKIRETSEKLSGFTGLLTDLNRELISAIRSIDETGSGLVNEIDAIIGSISIHEDVALVSDAVISNLREIFSEVTRQFPFAPRINDFNSMQSYDQMLEVEVKLLQSEGKAGVVRNGSEEFGQNVELFS